MEIDEDFEEWDESFIQEVDESLRSAEQDHGPDTAASEAVGETSDDSDDDSEGFKCSKCRKMYHTKGWLTRHEHSCTGAREAVPKRKASAFSEHQKRTRTILTELGFEEYFDCDCLPALLKCLQVITNTANDVIKLRGTRFAECKRQAEIIIGELQECGERETTTSDAIFTFIQYLAKQLWDITFARDSILNSSRRHQYAAQHLHAFRQNQEMLLKWTELCQINTGLNVNDNLFLQKLVTVIFEDISRYRHESVTSALQIKEEYLGETQNPTFLTSVEKDIVAYIAGYVCRKTRDRLQRYCNLNTLSKPASKDKCRRFELIIKVLTQMVPSMGQQTPMTYPNLMTRSLTRGGLSSVGLDTYNFFCYLEVSIRPFLNLARFRCSTRNSDSELLDQLIENSTLLKPTWPYSTALLPDDSNLLMKLFVDLYFRVRKWAYLKVYKEERKVKERLTLLKSGTSLSVELHGKDSIRKALKPS